MESLRGSIRGGVVKRAEDPRFVAGQGNYVTDMRVEGALWAVFVRSTVAHGTIASIDTSAAREMPGVVGVFTADDIPGSMPAVVRSLGEAAPRPLLARDRVRHVGDPVAVVVAESEREAVDAAEAVWVDYEVLPAVASLDAALAEEAELLYPELGSNVVAEGGFGPDEDVLADAEVVVTAEMHNQRVAPVPLETSNALAIPRPDGGAEVWLGSQAIHYTRNTISRALGIDRELLHVRTPDMGGGFGAKINCYREQVVVVALALKLGRPVRWHEGRAEGMLSMSHGRDQRQYLELGARRDGTIVGMRWSVTQDAGAYPLDGAIMAELTARMASGAYRIPALEFRWRGVVTNTTPVDNYRGAGRPEAAAAIERMMDLLAAELDMDPAEVRRRNFVPPDEFPYVATTGERYDTGDYAAALALALETAGYEELRAEQAQRRRRGDRRQLGIGISSYVEVTAPGGRKDWGRAEVTPDGVVIYSGALSHGQGHETVFAQIASDILGVPFERIRFVQGDTDYVVRGGGTMGSRSLQMAGSAVTRAAEAAFEKARRIYAHNKEAALDDVVRFDDGRIGIAGVPDSAMSILEIAALAADPANLPPGEEPGIVVDEIYEQAEATVPFGTHISVVEVDIETGEVEILRHVACDDCGRILNRMVVDGQVHGGVAQGVGQALFEHFRYDADGNPLTGNLTTYLLPTATTLPAFEVVHTETPTDQNPLGVKGIGEAGTIGSTPAVVNAVHDALRPFGVRHLDMPLTPARIWEALRAARA
ncbi:MAG: xanthine dehydrogenase family protein molybdopterin-binding subunit [Acidimicrobiia bacterium]